jgi:hypothetical protein
LTLERPREGGANKTPSCVSALNALFSLFNRTALGFNVATSSSDARLTIFVDLGDTGGGVLGVDARRRFDGGGELADLCVAVRDATLVVVAASPATSRSSFVKYTVVVSGISKCPEPTVQSSFAILLNLDDVYNACRI